MVLRKLKDRSMLVALKLVSMQKVSSLKGHNICSNLFARGWRNCTDVTGQLEGYLSTNCRQRLWAGCMLYWLWCIMASCTGSRHLISPWFMMGWWVVVTTQQIFQYGVKSVKQRIAVGSQVDLHTAKPGPGCCLIAIVETSDKIASWLLQFYWFIGLVYLHDQTGRLRLQACSPLTLCLRKGKSPCDEVSRQQEEGLKLNVPRNVLDM